MTIFYHAGDIVKGLSTDTLPLNVPDFTRYETTDTEKIYTKQTNNLYKKVGSLLTGGWVELARTTLGSTGDNITVSNLPDKRYYMLLMDGFTTGSVRKNFQMGNSTLDTGSNYAERTSADGAADATAVSQTRIQYGRSNIDEDDFAVSYIANLSAKEKLFQSCSSGDNAASGAGTAPTRIEAAGKWVNTSNSLDILSMLNTNAGDWATGAELVVLGWDPTDTHTDNFWEELVSVSGTGSSTTLSSGTFAAKKYLWVQAYSAATSQDSAFQFNNDTSTNYTHRRSVDGTEATSTSESMVDLSFGSPSYTNMFIINNSAREKLCISHSMDVSTAGAGTAPRRYERASKWANTAAQITEIDFINQSTSVNFGTEAFLKVWGAN